MSDRPTRDHNVRTRNAAITKALADTYDADVAIEAAIAEHVTPYRSDKRDIKKMLRDDFELPTRVFNARYAIYRMVRRAQEAADEITLDSFRELFRLTPKGETPDMFKASPSKPKKKDNLGDAMGNGAEANPV